MILCEIDFLLKIWRSIPCSPPSWGVHPLLKGNTPFLSTHVIVKLMICSLMTAVVCKSRV